MTRTFTILGCGNSAGTPAIGNHWGQCDPAEPRNLRTRPSAAITSATTTIVIDTGPDFRLQMNRENIRHVDAVLYTHSHGDHISGIDDLRVLRCRSEKIIDIYGDQETIADLSNRFNYVFIQKHEIYPKVVEPHVLTPQGHFNLPQLVGDIEFIPFAQDHGTCRTLGYRFGDLAYSTDVVDLDQQALETLRGIKTWVVDGAGYKMQNNLVHFTLRQVFAMNEIIQAEKVYLTHLPPSMDYRTLLNDLPGGYEPAYDGLRIGIS